MAKHMDNRIWEDKKRHFRLPLSFTRYSLTEDRIYLETGFFTRKEEEILLYRVRDVSLVRTFGQRLLGEGTVCIKSADMSIPHLDLKNILRSREVKDMISEKVEQAKERRGINPMEILDGAGPDLNSNGIPDIMEKGHR